MASAITNQKGGTSSLAIPAHRIQITIKQWQMVTRPMTNRSPLVDVRHCIDRRGHETAFQTPLDS